MRRQRRQSEAKEKKGDWSWIGWKARLHGSNRTRKKNKGHGRYGHGVSDFGSPRRWLRLLLDLRYAGANANQSKEFQFVFGEIFNRQAAVEPQSIPLVSPLSRSRVDLTM